MTTNTEPTPEQVEPDWPFETGNLPPVGYFTQHRFATLMNMLANETPEQRKLRMETTAQILNKKPSGILVRSGFRTAEENAEIASRPEVRTIYSLARLR